MFYEELAVRDFGPWFNHQKYSKMLSISILLLKIGYRYLFFVFVLLCMYSKLLLNK